VKRKNSLDREGCGGADRRMDDKTQKPVGPTAAKAKRDAALAQALRDNLKRRKAGAAPAKKEQD
jgi:hypothetical protein